MLFDVSSTSPVAPEFSRKKFFFQWKYTNGHKRKAAFAQLERKQKMWPYPEAVMLELHYVNTREDKLKKDTTKQNVLVVSKTYTHTESWYVLLSSWNKCLYHVHLLVMANGN